MGKTATGDENGAAGPVVVRRLTADDRPALLDLRWRVLRAGRPRSAALMPGDDEPTTIHLGAFLPHSAGAEPPRLVGIASLMEANGLQLRGMATDPGVRGLGCGRLILLEAQRIAAERAAPLWCNARLAAVGFYEKQGWKVEGELFDIPDVGPHYRMRFSQGGHDNCIQTGLSSCCGPVLHDA